MTITFFDADVPTSDEHLSIETLIYFITEIRQLTTTELEQLVDHIVSCKDCRKSIEEFIATSKDVDQTENCPETTISSLFVKITQIIHEIDMQNDIGTYIEVFERQGKDEAARQFPFLVNHIKKCKVCRSQIDETLILLHQAIDSGLITPFK